MKFISSFLFTITIISTFCLSSAKAADPIFKCTGTAEMKTIAIKQLTITRQKVTMTYQIQYEEITKNYKTVEFLNRNGSVGRVQTFFIGANQSGDPKDYNDDMSMPHFGLFPDGLGSEIAFDHKGNRVFGVISCKEE